MSEPNICPNTRCETPVQVALVIRISTCQVVCSGCGMRGPDVQLGDGCTTSDKERKDIAVGLWNLLPRLGADAYLTSDTQPAPRPPECDLPTQPGYEIPEPPKGFTP